MKYAIIETGGKQYKVSEGKSIRIEKVPAEAGKVIEFTKVLAVNDEDKLQVGTPTLEKAQVSGEIVKNGRDKKILVFKMKRRKGYSKKQGHRQSFTEVKINKISIA
ncbi:MAG: 50S ribosomal protein L21 [Deltaproteobacteria bacterium]|nr:50S ribosomal protein L21 [Deltaproteobacteria bacterium]